MEVRVLGTVEVGTEGSWSPVEGPKERALLATLALSPGRNVPPARLVDALWGDTPPQTADKMLQWHVSRLRKAIGHEVVATTPSGYVLDVGNGHVDALVFVDGRSVRPPFCDRRLGGLVHSRSSFQVNPARPATLP
jgi:DNA-binding SARP family transcriptional activator